MNNKNTLRPHHHNYFTNCKLGIQMDLNDFADLKGEGYEEELKYFMDI